MGDNEKFEESHAELRKFLSKLGETSAPLIILLHKMDVEGASQNVEEVQELFSFSDIFTNSVLFMETTIQDPATLDELKNLIEEVLTN
jgi:ADP-ribosylation factor family protein